MLVSVDVSDGVTVGVCVPVGVLVGVSDGSGDTVAKGVTVGVSVKRIIGVRDGSIAISVSGGGVFVGATVGVAFGTARLQPAITSAILPQKINRNHRFMPVHLARISNTKNAST